jgi:hypothetical protein
MKIQKIDKKIIKIVVDESDYDLDDYNNNLIYLESKKILTFGDTNFKVFEKFFKENGYTPESLDLCYFDDKSIGLEMPKTWYLNKGKHALSIATYYNYLNFHGIVENKKLDIFNKKIFSKFGRVSCIEIYLEDELVCFLNKNKIEYFGTPKTLTECVRYLEGWNIEKYPRLKGYITFSKFIELWSRLNFPDFNANEWYLGKERSNEINLSGRLTNVREAVRFFWKNYLSRKHGHSSNEDVEIDILDGNKFYNIRQPKLILISEDLFSEENSNFEIFTNLTKKIYHKSIFISKKKNNFPFKNAKIASKIYPNSTIVLIETSENFGRNFSLMNPIKQTINCDVVIASKVLRYMLENIK